MMKEYKHIFFDLDRTLWDFENNAIDALSDIAVKFNLLDVVGDTDEFISVYKINNEKLWDLYREKKIVKRILRWMRFHDTLKDFGIDDEFLAKKLGEEYVKISVTKTRLFPYTHEILRYLSDKYSLHLITNGFEEVQYKKLKNCNLEQYFDKIITSEKAEAHKPKPEIFNLAFQEAGTSPDESIMIGDDFKIDIEGAMNVGMDQIYFNSNQQPYESNFKPTYEITSLIEIENIL